MLCPNETAAIERMLTRVPGRMAIAVLIGLLCAVLSTVAYLSGEGRVDHLLGRDEAVTATVEHVEDLGHCNRQRSNEYYVELSWDSGEGGYTRCGGSVPKTGDTRQVWVGPSNHVEEHSPTVTRIRFGVLNLFVIALPVGIVTLSMRLHRNSLRRLLSRKHGALAPPLDVTIERGPKRRLWLLHSAPQHFGKTRKLALHPILINAHQPGKTVRTRRSMTGSWSIHRLQPNDGPGQIGLLTRGNERCWVQFRRV